ncbi:MAG: EAL domain-containing protein [Pseudomonadota bacterium]
MRAPSFTFKFTAMAALAFLMALLGGVYVVKTQIRDESDHLRNLARKSMQQTLLAFHVGELSGELLRTADPQQRIRLINRILDDVIEMDRLQAILVTRSIPGTGLVLPRAAGDIDLNLLHRDMQPVLIEFYALVAQVTGAEDEVAMRRAVGELNQFGVSEVFPRLGLIDGQYIAEEKQFRQGVVLVENGMILLLLSAILAEALFVFRPLARQRDAEQRRHAKAVDELQRRMWTDPLTGLPNEAALQRFLRQADMDAVLHVVCFEVTPAAVLSQESRTGIMLAAASAVAEKLDGLDLSACYRSFAQNHGFTLIWQARSAARAGPTEAALHAHMERIAALAETPLDLMETSMRLQIAIGLAEKPARQSAVKAVDDARLALRAARGSAEGRAVYSPEIRRDFVRDRRLGSELRSGIAGGEIYAALQPQLDLSTGAISGFEALARWRHPVRGELSPGAFLPLAKETGLDEPLGEAILRQGLEALRAWDARGFSVPNIGINMAQSHLSNPRLVDLIQWELDRFDLPPERLCLEVLENVHAPHDDDPILRNLAGLSSLGVRIDLDDFGTGSASINGIRRFHAKRVKIDRSFITALHQRPEQATLVTTMVRMAGGLHVSTLAEGVETDDEMAFLAGIGCGHVQGFRIARPMPLDQTFGWIENHRPHIWTGAAIASA